jgi:hypothetical protein
MEQLVVILVFAVCAAVCVNIFVESYLMERHTQEVNNSVRAAVNGAEIYKAAGGDRQKAVQILGGIYDHAEYGAVVFYDDRWNPCEEGQASYTLRIDRLHGTPALAEVTVAKTNGEILISLPVAARGDE